MGTFIISGANFIGTNSAPARGWGSGAIGSDAGRPTNDQDLLAGINSLSSGNPSLYAGWVSGDTTAVGSWLIRFFFGLSNNVIALDGNPAISFNNLPVGAEILTATLKIQVSQYPGSNADAANQLFLQQGFLTESADLHQVASPLASTKSFAYNFGVGKGRFIDVLLNGFGIRMPITQAGSVGQQFFNARIDGTYDISQSVTFYPTVQTPDPVRVGDKIKVSSPAKGLKGTTQVQLSFIDASQVSHLIIINIDPKNPYLSIDGVIYFWIYFIILQDDFNLWFYLPWGFKRYKGPVLVTLIGDGVQFSGSVITWLLQILFTDASGMYTLDDTKTNDLLYVRSGFTTDSTFLYLSILDSNDETYDDDFFEMLGYPKAIMSQSINFDNDDFIPEDWSFIGVSRVVVLTKNVEIPSPFIKTAFLP